MVGEMRQPDFPRDGVGSTVLSGLWYSMVAQGGELVSDRCAFSCRTIEKRQAGETASWDE